MASKLYTSFYELKVDLGMYLAWKSNDPYTLDLLPSIARGRYQWLVDNWNTFYPRFKNYANGDQKLENALTDFERSVQSTKLGNTVNVLTYPDKFVLYSPFLFLITFTEIKPNKDEKDFMRRELSRVQGFDISNFRSMVAFLKEQHNLTCDYIGLGDVDAAALRDESIAPRKRSATVEDLATLEDSLELERFIEGIIVQFKQTSGTPPNLLKIGNNNLSADSTVTINDAYKSYISIPFAKSLSQMAYQYLGSADRWFELVTANGLKSPYVDLYGEKQYLVSSGSGNSMTIQDTRKEWISLSCQVYIGSITQKEQPRIVEKINDNKDGTLTIFLSGEKNLSAWKTEEKGFVRVYYPNTVNERSMIYIPLDVTSPLTRVATPSSDELRRLGQQVLAFGVDIQRDERTGDILLDSTGDFKKSYGAANLRQTIHHILSTVRSENQWHPEYGISDSAGDTWFNTLAESEIIALSIQNAILTDSRIKNCVVGNIEALGTSLNISMIVMLQDSTVPIPLSFIA